MALRGIARLARSVGRGGNFFFTRTCGATKTGVVFFGIFFLAKKSGRAICVVQNFFASFKRQRGELLGRLKGLIGL